MRIGPGPQVRYRGTQVHHVRIASLGDRRGDDDKDKVGRLNLVDGRCDTDPLARLTVGLAEPGLGDWHDASAQLIESGWALLDHGDAMRAQPGDADDHYQANVPSTQDNDMHDDGIYEGAGRVKGVNG